VITADQLRTLARKAGLVAGIVEKDYALTWLLHGLYAKDSRLRNSFVLKGGTAIRKVYFPETWRFSEDLDFTLVGAMEESTVRGGLLDSFERIRSLCGMKYVLDSFHANPGAIIASVQFFGPLNFPNRIRHDISLKEKMALKPERHNVKSSYPDLHDFKVFVYSLSEIVAEKIRSIMQRGYSRDYYDVWRLLKEGKLNATEITSTLVSKCASIGFEYKPRLIFDGGRLKEAKSFWKAGLGHLTQELPEFDKVLDELRESLRLLEI